MSSPHRKVLLVPWLVLASVLGAADATPHRVLIMHSVPRGGEPHETFSTALRAALTADPRERIEIHEMSLATALLSEAALEPAFVDYLTALDAERRLDLIVAVGGPAVRFVQRNRERVFANTPLLIAGADQRLVTQQALTANDAQVSMRLDLAGAFANLFELFPDTTNVVVVFGASPLEQYWKDELRREYRPFADRARLTFYDDLPYDRLLERAAALSTGSAIFYALYLMDVDGAPHTDDAALTALRSVSTVPLFGLFDFQLGKGIVGGPLNSMHDLARDAAEAARRILRGEDPSRVRLPAKGPGAPAYDGRELQRFGIDAARLSPGSTIRFRAPSFWDANRWIVLGVVGIVGLEAALIAILVVNLAGRKRAEEELRDMSRRLIVAQEEERARLGRELHDDITQRLARLAIDTAAAGQGRADASGSDAMRRISEGLIRLSEDVHALSYRLHPSLVEDLGLAEALQVECDRFGGVSSVPAVLRLHDVPDSIPHDVAIGLYRVAQEALRNVGRHARARSVEVVLRALDGGLQLAVRDDGIGFDPSAGRTGRSLGHASMRERVHLLAGEIDIESAPGHGTTVVAWVPLRETHA